jgi:hypothetical protein
MKPLQISMAFSCNEEAGKLQPRRIYLHFHVDKLVLILNRRFIIMRETGGTHSVTSSSFALRRKIFHVSSEQWIRRG